MLRLAARPHCLPLFPALFVFPTGGLPSFASHALSYSYTCLADVISVSGKTSGRETCKDISVISRRHLRTSELESTVIRTVEGRSNEPSLPEEMVDELDAICKQRRFSSCSSEPLAELPEKHSQALGVT